MTLYCLLTNRRLTYNLAVHEDKSHIPCDIAGLAYTPFRAIIYLA